MRPVLHRGQDGPVTSEGSRRYAAHMVRTALLLTAGLMLGACGDDNGPATTGGSTSGATTGAGTSSDTGSTSAGSTSGTSGSTTDSGSTGSTDTSGTGTTGAGSTGSGTAGASTGGSSGGAIETCGELQTAFTAETASIRGCQNDGECGQVLMGTSCGCTRNWVARNDADTTYFYELIEMAGPLSCDLALGSGCDCPETDGFVCDSGTCNWNYI